MKVGAVLTNIELGRMDLPRLQRGYMVEAQVGAGVLRLALSEHPVGNLLPRLTRLDDAAAWLARDGVVRCAGYGSDWRRGKGR